MLIWGEKRTEARKLVPRKLLPSKEPCFCVSYATIAPINSTSRRLADLHGKPRLEDVIFFNSTWKNVRRRARFFSAAAFNLAAPSELREKKKTIERSASSADSNSPAAPNHTKRKTMPQQRRWRRAITTPVHVGITRGARGNLRTHAHTLSGRITSRYRVRPRDN